MRQTNRHRRQTGRQRQTDKDGYRYRETDTSGD